MARTAPIESLEPRQLLSFSVSGTTGNDVIEVLPAADLFTLDIFVNGALAGSTDQNDITINGLAGNDQLIVQTLRRPFDGAFDIKFFGGPGDDIIHAGDGSFDYSGDPMSPSDFGGFVRFREMPGEGNDAVFIDNTTNYDPPGSINDPFSPVVFSDHMGGIFYDDNIEHVELDESAGNDKVTVESVPSGFELALHEGNNTVTFGGAAKKINGELARGVVFGGSGTDKVIFDDSAGDQNVNRDYPIASNGIMNQILVGIDQAEIRMRRNFTGVRNSVVMSFGTGNVSSLKLVGSSLEVNDTGPRVLIGTPTAPVDLDAQSVSISAEFQSAKQIQYEIWDNDADQSGNAMIIDADSNHQVVQKGAMVAKLINGSSLQLAINTGSSNDVFQVNDTLPLSTVTVNGGGGDDTLLTIPDVTHGNAPEQVFLGSAFVYDGGAGDDLITLDDRSAAFTGATDEYQISTGFTKNGHLWMTHQNVDRVNFIAGGQNNIIRIDTRALPGLDKSYTIDAGFGNDTITTFIPGLNGGALGANVNLSLIAGPGTDTLIIDDTLPESLTNHYTLDASSFSYSGIGAGTFSFDGTLEEVFVIENNGNSTTQLNAKRSGLSLDLELAGGDDTLIFGGGDLDSSGLMAGGVTIFGGAGSDSITFDDHLDTEADGVSSYTLDNFSLAKGTASILYSAFENQTLKVEEAIVPGQFFTIPLVNLNAVSSFFDSTTIVGGDQGCTVNVGNGDLVNIAGTLTLQNCTSVNLDDTSVSAARSYVLTQTGMTAPRPMTFDHCGSITLNAGSGSDAIVISGSVAGNNALSVHGNGGNDSFNIGAGTFDNLLGPITVSGDGGADTLRLDYRQDPDLVTASLRNGGFTANGIDHQYSSIEIIQILAGDGGSDFTIQAVPFLTLPAISTTTFSGGSGADQLTIGTGNVGVRGNVSVDGGSGSDTLILNDSTSGGNSTYTFDVVAIDPHLLLNRFYKDSPTFSVSRTDIQQTILQANRGNNTITVQAVTDPLTILSGAGNDRVVVLNSTRTVTVNTGPENLNATSAPFGDSIEINTDFGQSGDIPATVLIDQDDSVLGLTVAQQGTLRIGSGAVLEKTAGSGSVFSVNGTIDLAGGSLLSRAGGSSPDFRTLLTRGYNGGAWNGTSASGAINSSLAAGSALSDGAGYGLGSQIGISTIGSFSIDPADTLLRYTLNGDANLDQHVDVSDLGVLATNWQGSSKLFADGDFNYDGIVDVSDLGALATNWQQSLSAPAAAEPGPQLIGGNGLPVIRKTLRSPVA